MPAESRDAAIRCWSCGALRGLADLLDADGGVLCQPVCDSFTVDCPGCGAGVWLDFNAGSVSVGQMTGFGARPDVDTYQTVLLGGAVEVDCGGRTIAYAGRVWHYR